MSLSIQTRGIDELRVLAQTFRTPALRALNKVARSAEVAANRKIRDTYNISRADVDREITVRSASISNLTATISARGKRIPLIRFSARQTKTGVSVTVKKGSRKTVAHAFIATMPTGHRGFSSGGARRGFPSRSSQPSASARHSGVLPLHRRWKERSTRNCQRFSTTKSDSGKHHNERGDAS